MENTFIGQIEARTDEKGRIFVPASYRKILAGSDSKRIVMRQDLENACLIFYLEPVWNQKVQTLRSALDEWSPSDALLLMQFMSGAEHMEPDNQGRILLPKRILEAIGVTDTVLFVGMLDRFAMWNPTVFREKCTDGETLGAAIRKRIAGRMEH